MPDASIAGPVDREDFFAAQRRHRRAASLLTALACVAVVFVGVPLAAIVFPLIFGVLALLSMLAARFTGATNLVDALLATGGHFGEGGAVLELIVCGLVVVLPGSLLMLAIWRRCLRLLGSLAPERIVESFGARLARGDDLEERQVANIVMEMAVAAGIEAPAVRILETAGINAAAFAPDGERALVLVTRGLLDAADRAQTQALLGSLVATIANGDARAAFRWMGVAATFNLAADLLHGPLAGDARARLVVLLPALRRGTLAGAGGEPASDAARVIELLLGPAPSIPDDPARTRLQLAMVFPFLFSSAMFNFAGFLANLLFLSPAFSLLMRRRRHLADATAVQLTRDPDSLAQGLALTVNRTAAADVPLARFAPLFLVAPTQTGDSAPLGQQFGTHPSVSARHGRVLRLGASLRPPTGAAATPLRGVSGWRAVLVLSLTIMASVLAILLVPLMLYLMIAVTLMALMVGMMYVMLVLLPLRWLLGMG
jgi:Zn-dependent protease with chaperone function